MHECIDCQGECDCDGEDTWYGPDEVDCTGCGCDEDEDWLEDDG